MVPEPSRASNNASLLGSNQTFSPLSVPKLSNHERASVQSIDSQLKTSRRSSEVILSQQLAPPQCSVVRSFNYNERSKSNNQEVPIDQKR